MMAQTYSRYTGFDPNPAGVVIGSLSFGRFFWSVAAILVLAGPLLGLAVNRIVSLSEDTRAQVRFDEVVSESAYLLEKELAAFSEVLVLTGAFFESSEYVTRGEFADFTRNALMRHPCIQAIEWIPLVPKTQRALHEQTARDEGLTDYGIWVYDDTTSLESDLPFDAHFPVFYVEPFTGNEAALGLDLGTESVREDAIYRAMRSRETAFTDPVNLVQGDGTSPGILAFHRVGDDQGLVLLVFEVAAMVSRTLFTKPFHDPGHYDFVLVDEDTATGPSILHLHRNDDAATGYDHLRTSRMIETAGKRWRLSAVPTRSFLARERHQAVTAGVGSAVLWELLCLSLIAAAALSKGRIQHHQNRLTRSVLASMSEGVIVANDTGSVVMTNQAAETILKISADKDFEPTFLHPDGTTPCKPEECPLSRAAAGDSIRDQIFCIHDEITDTNTWLTINAEPMIDQNGNLEGGLIVMRDISARKRTDEVVDKLFNAVEHTDDAVFITTRDGRIEYINPAFTRVTGYTKREAIGKTPRLLKSGEHPPEHYKNLWATVLSGNVFRNTITNRRKSGETFTADQTITPMRDITGRISNFVSVSKDMTEFLALQERELHMTVAANVQRRLYPQEPPMIQGLDLAGAVFPADETCGDYYDYIEMPNGDLGIVVGDVSGHGIGAAMVMMETRAMLRALIEADWSVEDIFARINQALYDDLDEGSFVTMILATVDPTTGRLSHVSAGHDTCFVLDGTGRLKYEMHSTGMPLGLVKGSAPRSRVGPTLDDGDVAVLVTDGLTDCQAHHGRFLETKTCLDAIRARLQEPAHEILAGLHTLVRDFSGDDVQQDDITIVVCKAGARDQAGRTVAAGEMRGTN